jgi:mono/diheme cytochrome c family protein
MRLIAIACLNIVATLSFAQEHAESENGHNAHEARMDHGMGRGSGGMHSMIRHRYVMREGLPDAYQQLTNPLSATDSVLANGQRVYTAVCAMCHGETGSGDGPAGAGLDPRPSNIRRLPRNPVMSSDAYLYWTIAQGGMAIETGMPAFEQALTSEDIWSVIAYLREGFED